MLVWPQRRVRRYQGSDGVAAWAAAVARAVGTKLRRVIVFNRNLRRGGEETAPYGRGSERRVGETLPTVAARKGGHAAKAADTGQETCATGVRRAVLRGLLEDVF